LNLTNVSMDTMPLYHRRGGVVVTARHPSINAATTDFSNLVLQCWPHSFEHMAAHHQHHHHSSKRVTSSRLFYDRSESSKSSAGGGSGSSSARASASAHDEDGDGVGDGDAATWLHELQLVETMGGGLHHSGGGGGGGKCATSTRQRTIAVLVGAPKLHVPHGGVPVSAQFAAPPSKRTWLARVHLHPADVVVSASLARAARGVAGAHHAAAGAGLREAVPFTVHAAASSQQQQQQQPKLLSGFTAGPSSLGSVVEVEIKARPGQLDDFELTLFLC